MQNSKDNKASGIYIILNEVNGKVYIGSSTDMYRRCQDHTASLLKNSHANAYLQHSWNKYGASSFTFNILEVVEDFNKLIEIEQQYLDLFESAHRLYGYNILPTAGSPLGTKQSEEVKLRKNESLRQHYINDPSARDRAAEKARGRLHKQESKDKVSEAKRGKKRPEFSEEWKSNMSASRKGKITSDETKARLSAIHKARFENESEEERLARVERTKQGWITRRANKEKREAEKQQAEQSI